MDYLYIRTAHALSQGWRKFSLDLKSAALKSSAQAALEEREKEMKFRAKTNIVTFEEVSEEAQKVAAKVRVALRVFVCAWMIEDCFFQA